MGLNKERDMGPHQRGKRRWNDGVRAIRLLKSNSGDASGFDILL